MTPPVHSFAVYPAGTDFVHPVPGEGAFDPFVLDVPSLSGEGFASRRAWWSAFHLLGPRGVEPEEFVVYELLADGTNGRRVLSGGLEEPEHETPWNGGWPA